MFFVTCDRERFLSTFSIAAKVATAKPVHEIFRYARVQAIPPNKLVVQAGDGTTFFVRTISGITAKGAGSTLLPSKSVAKLLRETKNTCITLCSFNRETVLATHSSQHSIPRDVDVETFPLFSLAFAEGMGTRVVGAEALARLFRRTAFAPIPPRGRSTTLDLVRLEFSEDTITAVATNGQRIAVQTIPVHLAQGEPNLKPVHLLMKSAQHILSTLGRQNVNVAVTRSEHAAVFRFTPASNWPGADEDELIVGATNYPGTFPDWPTVLPKSPPAWTLTIAADALLRAVKQANLLTRKDSSITLELREGHLKVSVPGANANEDKAATTLAPISISARDSIISAHVKAKFLANFLRVLDAKTPVTLHVRAHMLPLVMTTEDGYTYAVAPAAF